jgi:hypothetical protein
VSPCCFAAFVNLLEIHYNFAANYLNDGFNKMFNHGNRINPKNLGSDNFRANAQSRSCGILFAQANGKLCFVQQTSFLQHKTTCPRAEVARERFCSEVENPF